MHRVEVAHRVLVEDHLVGLESLEPPILLRLEDMAHEGKIVLLVLAHQKDGQIARDPVGPEALLAQRALGLELGRRAERSIRVQHPGGQAL